MAAPHITTDSKVTQVILDHYHINRLCGRNSTRTMQAGIPCGTPDPNHQIPINNEGNEKHLQAEEDCLMQDQANGNAVVLSAPAVRSSEPTVVTRLQQKKRAATSQPEGPTPAESQEEPVPQRAKLVLQKKKNQKKATTTAQSTSESAGQAPSSTSSESNENLHAPQDSSEHRTPKKSKDTSIEGEIRPSKNAGIESAITRAQEKVRVETKEKDEMWGRIAKAVDVAMSAEAPGKIEDYQIEHIVEAILDCALPKTQLQAARRSAPSQENVIQVSKPVSSSNKPESWANIAAQNAPKAPKATTKPSLKQPFRGMRADSRLMIRLGENSPHRNEHPFLLQKKANAILPANVVVGKVAHVNSGLALISPPQELSVSLR